MKRSRAVAILLLCAACGAHDARIADDAPFEPILPKGAPALIVPADNALTEARVALGKKLLFEARLSANGNVACASCHRPDHAFSDTVALSVGAHGAKDQRNTPTLANVAWLPALMADGGVPTLEQQVLAPMLDEHEMATDIDGAVKALRDTEPYRSLSAKAYGRALDGRMIAYAIACYERTLISGWSRFDRFRYAGDSAALNAQEVRGWKLFNSSATGCADCHNGFDLSDHGYHNVGVASDDPGRERITLRVEDRGKFRTPTLRNIVLTAPYMHNGSMATLEQVIDHFANGGADDANKGPRVHALALTAQDKADLIAFLGTLTDERSLDQVQVP